MPEPSEVLTQIVNNFEALAQELERVLANTPPGTPDSEHLQRARLAALQGATIARKMLTEG